MVKANPEFQKEKNCCVEKACPLILLYNSTEWG